ncbi:MAG: tetratricopeptide repeat protein [Candidatus Obscuribacterales bacterium]|nr:tetratricopeptide repeat protein [Candidatus Obscuribacterales bacterium]
MNTPQNQSDNYTVYWTNLRARAEKCFSQGDYDTCEQIWGQALPLLKEKRQRDYCHALEHLAEAQLQLKKYEKAKDNFRESLEIKFRALGRNHAAVAHSYGNMAKLFYMMGDYARSERWAIDCASIYETALGEESQALSCALHNLATLYQAQKRFDVAEQFFEKAMAMKLNVFGQAHFEFVNLLRSYAQMLRQVGRKSDAEHLDQCASGKISGKWLVPDQKPTPFKQLQLDSYYR